MTRKRLDVHQLFESQQKALLATLQGGREVHSHMETMGTAAELQWRNMLCEFLPKRYSVEKASVIDADGNVSDQFDAVIHDRHFSPTWMVAGGSRYIPAESVYGVVEVKQDLTRAQIGYAIKKADPCVAFGAPARTLHLSTAASPAQSSRRLCPSKALGGIRWETD